MTVFTRPDAADVLLRDPRTKALLEDATARIAKGAADVVPEDSGYLKRSYRSTSARMEADGLRSTAYTYSSFGHWWEWGTSKRPPLAPLRRAAERLGFRTKPTPKGQA